ncbi:hypothetical protein PC129_g7544 [Phytophthora cactorum]|uniref:Uncharacterized protein n=1 Tax=Phytophthora cactorum TaxID=29920 RepID=A0A329STL4_9STRA|nr:hypothetical protein Pcac1_g6070 [Phytophthora cactorum]KAG2826627.1 hypothetical protein PC112_g9204 [Phytophthora cactorum]KAG2828362.1 hypothetical protein PC111_g8203 [Phytophthora cactorum]KAG2858657.1 hypothetical protein PC113_g9623 [Phytophthora cactorum]KAG2909108.1 hypothetical protein PC114_g10204 [Phytophthora cactorum]
MSSRPRTPASAAAVDSLNAGPVSADTTVDLAGEALPAAPTLTPTPSGATGGPATAFAHSTLAISSRLATRKRSANTLAETRRQKRQLHLSKEATAAASALHGSRPRLGAGITAGLFLFLDRSGNGHDATIDHPAGFAHIAATGASSVLVQAPAGSSIHVGVPGIRSPAANIDVLAASDCWLYNSDYRGLGFIGVGAGVA